jgi:hypothetical protein
MDYAWDFVQLECKKESEGQQDVVFVVHWRFTGSEDGFSSSVIGTSNFHYEEGSPFIPFANLTESDVQGWVESKVDLDDMKAQVSAEVAEQRTPTTESLAPPW